MDFDTDFDNVNADFDNDYVDRGPIASLLDHPGYMALLAALEQDARITQAELAEAVTISDLVRIGRYWQCLIRLLGVLRGLPADIAQRLAQIRETMPDEEGDFPRPPWSLPNA